MKKGSSCVNDVNTSNELEMEPDGEQTQSSIIQDFNPKTLLAIHEKREIKNAQTSNLFIIAS